MYAFLFLSVVVKAQVYKELDTRDYGVRSGSSTIEVLNKEHSTLAEGYYQLPSGEGTYKFYVAANGKLNGLLIVEAKGRGAKVTIKDNVIDGLGKGYKNGVIGKEAFIHNNES